MTIYSYLSWFTKTACSDEKNLEPHNAECFVEIVEAFVKKNTIGSTEITYMTNLQSFFYMLLHFNMGMDVWESLFPKDHTDMFVQYYRENLKYYAENIKRDPKDPKYKIDYRNGNSVHEALVLFPHMLT